MQERTAQRQRGTSLIETVIATAMCMIAVFALAGLVSMSTSQSKNMGTTVAQATALAGQKLDELMALEFNNTLLDPGSSQECLRPDGTLTTCSAADSFFTRAWRVQMFGALTTVKQITVRVEGRVIGTGLAPSATVAALKAQL